MRGVRVVRVAALSLLAFAALDLLVPGLCLADQEQPVVWEQSQTLDSGQWRTAPDVSPQHDDCFCCCGHVTPSLRWQLIPQWALYGEYLPWPAAATESSPHPITHPPRV